MTNLQIYSVDVLRRNETPAHFLWHGRLYSVRSVLAHWLEPLDQSPEDAPLANLPVGSSVVERELWRVSAAAGRSAEPVTLDVCFARAQGDWTVAEVLD